MDKVCAVIVAAGKGKRMGAGINKQFLEIKEKPILAYTLEAFSNNKLIDEICIVTSRDEILYCEEQIVNKYKINKVTNIVEGGKERQHSVFNGLKVLEKCSIVLIHDGARPFVNDKIIEDGIKYAKLYGASACGVSPKDTIKIKDFDGFSIETPERNMLFSVHTPQCFNYELIYNSHEKAILENFKATDDTMIVENYGNKVYLYEGSYSNIKITTPEDLIIGESILNNRVF